MSKIDGSLKLFMFMQMHSREKFVQVIAPALKEQCWMS